MRVWLSLLLLLVGLSLAPDARAVSQLPCANVIQDDGKPDCLPIMPGKAMVPDAATARGLSTGGAVGINIELAAQANGAPALDLISGTGPCAVDDGVSCINSHDGNHWSGNFGVVNALYWGVKGDGVTDDLPALNAAIAYAASVKRDLYVPASPKGLPYFISNQLEGPVLGSTHITGDHPSFRLSNSYDAAHNLSSNPVLSGTWFATKDTGCIHAQVGQNTRFEHLGCLGNGALSTSSNHTIAFNLDRQFAFKGSDLLGRGYVICVQVTTESVYPAVGGIHCDERSSYPNRTNDYPSYCWSSANTGIPFLAVAAGSFPQMVCRGGAEITVANFTGNGSTTFFDMSLGGGNGTTSATNIMWAPDELYISVGGVPVPIGQGYTLYDCGAAACGGSGGTPLLIAPLTVGITQGSNIATITSGSTTGWPAIASPSQLLVWSLNGIDEPTFVQSKTDATHFVMSTNARVTNPAVAMRVVQVGVGRPGGDMTCQTGAAPSCGHNIEIRFAAAPANGAAIQAIWQKAFLYISLNDHDGDNNYFEGSFTGARLLFKHTGFYGGDVVQANYVEIMMACYSADQQDPTVSARPLSGDVVRMGRQVSPAPPETYLGPNGWVESCPIYIDPASANMRFLWNGSDWTKTTLPGNNSFFAWGSPTAPLNQAPGVVHEFRLQNTRCSISNQLEFLASETGAMLGGTNYEYHVQTAPVSAGTYAAVNSPGAAFLPLSGNINVATTAGMNGLIRLHEAGIADIHQVDFDLGGNNGSGTFYKFIGGGAVIGTPAPLVTAELACGNGGSALTGSVFHRVVN